MSKLLNIKFWRCRVLTSELSDVLAATESKFSFPLPHDAEVMLLLVSLTVTWQIAFYSLKPLIIQIATWKLPVWCSMSPDVPGFPADGLICRSRRYRRYNTHEAVRHIDQWLKDVFPLERIQTGLIARSPMVYFLPFVATFLQTPRSVPTCITGPDYNNAAQSVIRRRPLDA